MQTVKRPPGFSSRGHGSVAPASLSNLGLWHRLAQKEQIAHQASQILDKGIPDKGRSAPRVSENSGPLEN